MPSSVLRTRLAGERLVRLVGAHDGLTAILVERAGFDGLWAGGLGVSTSAGVPDAGLLTMTELLTAAARMRQVSSQPIIADVDSGFGDLNVVGRMIRLYESAGIDAVCIEDKQYPKRNSFREGNVLEEPERFARKISVAKNAQVTSEFMVVARLESLIARESVAEAGDRARLYLSAGADALVIHSKRKNDIEIAEFCRAWRSIDRQTALIAIPTTYYTSTGTRLKSLGINAAIYANQLIRASVRAMRDALDLLHTHESTAAMEDSIVPVSTLFELTGTDNLLEDEPAGRH
jgi:phosphoenolpyruvate phosphomutase